MTQRLPVRAALLIGVCVALLLATLSWPQPLLFVLFVGTTVVAVLGTLLPWLSLRGVQARVDLDAQGQPVLLVQHRGGWPAAMVQVETQWRWGTREVVLRHVVPWLWHRQSCRLPLAAMFPCRGHYRLCEIRVASGFPLGLVEPSKRQPTHGLWYLVLPRAAAVDLPAVAHDIEDPRSEQVNRRLGQSMELGLLLPYQPGDALRRTHWRASARTGSLVIQHFHQSGAPTLRLVCELPDEAQAGVADAPAELAIRVAAGLCAQAAQDGLRVIAHLLPHGAAISGASRICDELAAIEPQGADVAATLRAAIDASEDGETLALVLGANAPADAALDALCDPRLRARAVVIFIAQRGAASVALLLALRRAGFDARSVTVPA